MLHLELLHVVAERFEGLSEVVVHVSLCVVALDSVADLGLH